MKKDKRDIVPIPQFKTVIAKIVAALQKDERFEGKLGMIRYKVRIMSNPRITYRVYDGKDFFFEIPDAYSRYGFRRLYPEFVKILEREFCIQSLGFMARVTQLNKYKYKGYPDVATEIREFEKNNGLVKCDQNFNERLAISEAIQFIVGTIYRDYDFLRSIEFNVIEPHDLRLYSVAYTNVPVRMIYLDRQIFSAEGAPAGITTFIIWHEFYYIYWANHTKGYMGWGSMNSAEGRYFDRDKYMKWMDEHGWRFSHGNYEIVLDDGKATFKLVD